LTPPRAAIAMKFSDWRWIKAVPKLLAASRREPERQAERIVAMQLHIVLPAKFGVIGVVLYYIFYSGWYSESPTVHFLVVEKLQNYFLIYVLCNLLAAWVLFLWRRFPPGLFQKLVFTLGFLDGLFIAGLMFLTGGFDSMAFWIFPGLIVLNAASLPLGTSQLALNLLLSLFYVTAGVMETTYPVPERQNSPFAQPHYPHPRIALTNAVAGGSTNAPVVHVPRVSSLDLPYEMNTQEINPSAFLPQVFVLWLLTACCYGVQVLAERQRRALDEAREFAMLEGQLHSAGRLAAEIAHQLKNPLSIINNTIFSIHRAVHDGKQPTEAQVKIIQEEIARADRILTDLMGYAQLNEGRVEKLNVAEELDQAIRQVFPSAAGFNTRVERHYAPELPPLLMQRRHLSEILINLLQNAREATHGQGMVSIFASARRDYAIEVIIADNGPGIAAAEAGKIFEPYFSTKEKGTGLGLAIVRHNIELYGGTVRVDSELGKGARFILVFPGKTVISLAKQTR
jgi:signal transduction histidine kinase